MRALSFLLSMGMTAATCTALAEPAVSHYRYRQETGWASTSVSFECGGGTLEIWAAEEATREGPGAPETRAIAHLTFSAYSYCAGTNSFAQVDLPLQQGISMRGMAMDFAIPVQNTRTVYDPEYGYLTEELAPSTLTGSIVLQGDGTTTVTKNRSFSTGFSGTQISVYRGKERSATALFTAALDGAALVTSPTTGRLVSTNSGRIDSPRQLHITPRLPSPPVAGNPASTISHNESVGGMASLGSGEDAGCIRNTLNISAYETTFSSLPDGAVDAKNGGSFEFSQSDNCDDPDVVHELHINNYVIAQNGDATQITPTLEAVAFSVDVPVYAWRCTWVLSTGDYQCNGTTVRLSADFLWEGIGDIVGGRSSGTYRTGDSFERDESAGYARSANLTQSFVVDGEPVVFGSSDAIASMWTQSFVRTVTPR